MPVLNTASKLYVGGNVVSKVYAGANQVWPAAVAAAPAFRSHTLSTYGSVANAVLDKPVGTAQNDVLVAALIQALSSAPVNATPPAGWTAIGSFLAPTDGGFFAKFSLWWLRAGAAEPATYQWSLAANNNCQGFIGAYSGCIGSGNPVDVFSQNSANAILVATALSVTTTGPNRLLLYLGHSWDIADVAPPASPPMTERADSLLYAADQVIAAAGATGDRTQTQTSNNPWSACLVALKGA